MEGAIMRVLGIVGGLVIALGSSPAWAGCPNACDMTITKAVVEPPLECMSVQAIDETCDCGVSLKIVNDCQVAIAAVDFELSFCWGTGSTTRETCSSVAPGEEGTFEERVDYKGARDWSFELEAEDGPHTVTFTSEVTEFNDGYCSVSAFRPAAASPWLALGFVALGWLGRRHKRQRAPSR